MNNIENTTVKNIGIESLLPNVIDNVLITFDGEKICFHLPKDMTNERFKRWKQGRGGVFYKDIKKWQKGFIDNVYVVIENEQRMIVRIIEEDEIKEFKMLGLMDGHIKDKSVMLLRNLNKEENLTKTNTLVVDNFTEMGHDPKIIIQDKSLDTEDKSNHGFNIILFGDDN